MHTLLPPIPDLKSGSYLKFVSKKFKNPPLAASLGWHVKGHAPIGPNPADPILTKGGLQYRVMRSTPLCKFYREFRSFVRLVIKKTCYILEDTDVMTFEEWLATRSGYNEKRKNQLRAAYASLETNELPQRNSQEWRRLMMNETHVKREFYLIRSFFSKLKLDFLGKVIEKIGGFKWSRMVNSRTDRSKPLYGPITHAVEHMLFFRSKLAKYFAKGTNLKDLPALMMRLWRPDSEFGATDHTSFEAHITAKISEICECQLYKYAVSGLSNRDYYYQLFDALSADQNLKMNNDSSKFKCTTQARMSGDCCTSLGNGFTNLMIMMFIAHKKGWKEFDGFFEGDDGIFRIDGEKPTSEDFADLGFTIKLETSKNLNELGFCQRYFTSDLLNVINPVKALVHSGWTRSPLMHGGTAILRQLSKAKAFSLICEAPRNPITSAMARWIIRCTQNERLRYSQADPQAYLFNQTLLDSKGAVNWSYLDECLETSRLGPSMEQRTLVEKLWNVSINDQICIENYFDSLNEICVIDNETITRVVENPVTAWSFEFCTSQIK